LQGLPHDELIDRVGFEPVDVVKKARRLDPGRPDDELRIDDRAVGKLDAIRRHRCHACGGVNLDAKAAKQIGCRFCDACRQGRQDSVSSLDQVQRDVPVGIDAIEPKCHEFARRLVQFSGEFDAGGAGADNCDLELSRP